MPQDAFSGGVEPGGLRSQNDIRILLCFILLHAEGAFSGEDLLNLVTLRGLANYFEAGDALAALLRQGNVEKDGNGMYTLSDTGREVAESLPTALPLSVRDKALDAALLLSARRRARRENRVEIEETEKGFRVSCHITDGEMELMAVSLYAPDLPAARRIEENFYASPERVYRALLAALTGERSFLEENAEEGERNADEGRSDLV